MDADIEPADLRALRRDHAAQIERLRAMHSDQLAAVRASSRYVIGDALVGIFRRPTSAPEAVRRVWRIFRQRRRHVDRGALPRTTHLAPTKSSLRIGAVLDEFSWSCFAPEAHLIPISPDSEAGIAADSIDLLLVESAWKGNGGEWSYRVNGAGGLDSLGRLVDACDRASIPAVFWNKEDPVGFEAFIGAARLFPTILTTDSQSVGRYRAETEATSVAAMPFAAQTAIHNPMGRPRDPEPRVCFAGAWRGDKYPERAQQLEYLMGPALERGVLDIFDRYHAHGERSTLGFPAPYSSAVRGTLSYEKTVMAYKRYAAFLNVNSVTDSPTMFSRRVFEILACGTPVISTPSQGIDDLLGDVVMTVRDARSSREAVDEMLNDRAARERRSHLGYRLVHGHHSYTDRLAVIAHAAGLQHEPRKSASVAFVCVTQRPHLVESIVEAFERQTYPNKHLVVVCNNDDVEVDEFASVVKRVPGSRVLFQPADRSLGHCLNVAIQEVDTEYIAKIDDDDEYGADYLADMMLTFAFSDAQIAGKRSYHAYMHSTDQTVLRFPGQEFAHVDDVIGGTLVFRREVAVKLPFENRARGTDTVFLGACRRAGHRIFSADRFNFIQHRFADASRHTWQIDDDEFLQHAEHVAFGRSTSNVMF